MFGTQKLHCIKNLETGVKIIFLTISLPLTQKASLCRSNSLKNILILKAKTLQDFIPGIIAIVNTILLKL